MDPLQQSPAITRPDLDADEQVEWQATARSSSPTPIQVDGGNDTPPWPAPVERQEMPTMPFSGSQTPAWQASPMDTGRGSDSTPAWDSSGISLLSEAIARGHDVDPSIGQGSGLVDTDGPGYKTHDPFAHG